MSTHAEDLDFDAVYVNGEYYIQDKATKCIVATAGSGGQALSLLARWNSPAGKIRAAMKLDNQKQEDEDYRRYKQTRDIAFD